MRDMHVHDDERTATSPTGRKRDGGSREKFAQTSLEDCQCSTAGQSVYQSHCEVCHVSVLSNR